MRERNPQRATVLKVGGSKLIDEEDLESLARHVLDLVQRGEQPVIVHGGGPEIGQMQQALGQQIVVKSGLRATPAEAMPITTMVLCGLVNKRVVGYLVAAGVRAIGLSGLDLGLLKSRLLNPVELGRVGGPPRVDVSTIESLLQAGMVPVLAPVAAGMDGLPVNINADTVAQAVAAVLRAETLDFISDVRGVRDDDGWVETIAKREVSPLIARAIVRGGMIPKLQAAIAAIEAGVGRVRVGSLLSLENGTATTVTP